MGFRGLLELLGITLEAPSAVIAPVECDFVMDVVNVPFELTCHDKPYLLDMENVFVLDLAQSDFILELDDDDFLLGCP